MIRPAHNREAINIISQHSAFPPLRFKRRSLLARECNALIQADRYMAKADKGRA